MTGLIFDIKRFALHDGPGLRTTVFFKGCPLRCSFCHNPEGQLADPELLVRPERCIRCGTCLEVCPTGALSLENGSIVVSRPTCKGCGRCAEACPAEALQLAGRAVTLEELLAEVERDRVFYEQSGGGVTCSGGEPVAQPEFLQAFLAEARTRSIHTVLDTSGFAPPETFRACARRADFFLYDLKLMDSERHAALTGFGNEWILTNLRWLVTTGKPVIVRIPLVEGVNCDEANLRAAGRFLSSLNPAPPVDLLPYHRTGEDKYLRLGKRYNITQAAVPTEEKINEAARCLRSFGLQVHVRGKRSEEKQ